MRTSLLVSGALLVTVALSACTSNTGSSPSAPAPSPSEVQSDAPVVEPTAESTTETLPPVARPSQVGGPWTAVDVKATSVAQIEAADALPESLRAFLATRLGGEDDAGCTTSEIAVKAVHPDGFAYGSEESDCGGGQAIWGITDDKQWEYIVQFQEAMPCADIAMNEVPKGAPGLRCLSDDGGQAQDY